MVWLSALLPYDQAAQVFARIGHQNIPRMSLWRRVESGGEALSQVWTAQQQATIARLGGQMQRTPQPQDVAKGMSLDGGMVHIRDEGWKEFKVGTIFEVIPVPQETTNEPVLGVRCQSMRYVAVLGDTETFAPQMWALALRAGALSAPRLSTTADGAAWIWRWVADYFPHEVEIVDWYHALTHLKAAAHALYPDDQPRALDWFEQRQDDLFEGRVDRIIQTLDDAFLSQHAHYFVEHFQRMQYADFRQQAYPIGSGTVESSIKQFKARLTGAGMRWSRMAAENMLLIRALVMADDLDDYWAQVA